MVSSGSANAVPLGSGSGVAQGRGDGMLAGRKVDEGIEVDEEEVGEGADGEEMDVDATTTTTSDWAGGIMMASLRNKNKKKGFFRQAMMRGLGVPEGVGKIVFEAQATASTSTSTSTPEFTTTQRQVAVIGQDDNGTTKRRPRLVPPSELQEKGLVPRNVVVTSVDVEEGMWDSGGVGKRKKSRGKGKGKQQEEDPDQFVDAVEEEDVNLVYDEGVDGYEAVDRTKIEIGWNNYPVLEERGQVVVGGVVGWKVRRHDLPSLLIFFGNLHSMDRVYHSTRQRLHLK